MSFDFQRSLNTESCIFVSRQFSHFFFFHSVGYFRPSRVRRPTRLGFDFERSRIVTSRYCAENRTRARFPPISHPRRYDICIHRPSVWVVLPSGGHAFTGKTVSSFAPLKRWTRPIVRCRTKTAVKRFVPFRFVSTSRNVSGGTTTRVLATCYFSRRECSASPRPPLNNRRG